MTYSIREYLPPSLREIADIAGERAAIDLAIARGGERVFIPSRLPSDHWLVLAVGSIAAGLIAAQLGGNYFVVPISPRSATKLSRRIADEALASGKSVNEAARLSGRSQSNLRWRRKNKLSHADWRNPQADLFGSDDPA